MACTGTFPTPPPPNTYTLYMLINSFSSIIYYRERAYQSGTRPNRLLFCYAAKVFLINKNWSVVIHISHAHNKVSSSLISSRYTHHQYINNNIMVTLTTTFTCLLWFSGMTVSYATMTISNWAFIS